MYIEQAFKFKHEVWRYLLGTLVVFILGWQFIGVIPLGIVSWLKASNTEEFVIASETAFSSLFSLNSKFKPRDLNSFTITLNDSGVPDSKF